MSTAPHFSIQEFGPHRIIGMSTRAKGPAECMALWGEEFLPRCKEIAAPYLPLAFGICRCIPGAADGTFEYTAAFEAKPDAPVPAGMRAMDLPRRRYAVLPVANLKALGAAWGSLGALFEAHPELEPYCGANGCACAEAASFELYPRDFDAEKSPLFLYAPLKKG